MCNNYRGLVSSKNLHFDSFESGVSILKKSVQDMLGKFDAFVHQGLGWMVKEVRVFSFLWREGLPQFCLVHQEKSFMHFDREQL